MNSAVLRPGMVVSLPAAARILALRDAGQSDRLIRLRADLTAGQLRRARTGQLIGYDVAARILALPAPIRFGPSVMNGTGTRRRLRALVAVGWPPAVLAAAIDVPRTMEGLLSRHLRCVSCDVYYLVRALYDQRWHLRPEAHGVSAADACAARAYAAAQDYLSPLAWDDDTIDCSSAVPRTGRIPLDLPDPVAAMRALEGERMPLTARTRTTAIEYGARHRGLDWDAIADLLGMERDSVKKQWERIKKRARSNGEAWPDRPQWTTDAVYEARDRREALVS